MIQERLGHGFCNFQAPSRNSTRNHFQLPTAVDQRISPFGCSSQRYRSFRRLQDHPMSPYLFPTNLFTTKYMQAQQEIKEQQNKCSQQCMLCNMFINFQQQMRNRQKAIDSISANELLNALKTLENINVIQDQLEDLNISFNQTENFNAKEHDGSQTMHRDSESDLKLQKKAQLNNDKGIQLSDDKRMDFQFYMTKKHNLKKDSKLNKSSISINKSRNKENQSHKSPLKINSRLSVSPLTQRKKQQNIPGPQICLNKMHDQTRAIRLKTQDHDKSKSTMKVNAGQGLLNRTVRSKVQVKARKENKQNKQNKQNNLKAQKVKVVKKEAINVLSMHERSVQFLKNKKEKMQRMQQEKQECLRAQEEKQYTFKPKVLANVNTKAKYLEFTSTCQIRHKRQESSDQEYSSKATESHPFGYRAIGNRKKAEESILEENNDEVDSLSQKQEEQQLCEQRKEQGQQQSSKHKKYKNMKFNVLLDLIH